MQALRRSTFHRRILVPFFLVAWLSGCHAWSTTGMSPGQLVREEQPDRVRVTWRGEQYELESPTIQADSLTGQGLGMRMALPFSEIERLETRQANVVGTVVLIAAGAVVGVFGFAFLLCAAVEECDPLQ